jgi:hypothetical protein
VQLDAAGRRTFVTLVAGKLGEVAAPPPPPKSWASRPESDLAIWTLRLEPGARWRLPAARPGTNRLLAFFAGDSLTVDGTRLECGVSVNLSADVEVPLVNDGVESELLLLQGRPIGEPVASYGPFVMNTMGEIQQAFADYRRTQFGGWPFDRDDPVHPREEGRFARHADGRLERPGS